MPFGERTPLLQDHEQNSWSFGQDRIDNYHTQFCKLVGIPPSNLPPSVEPPRVGPKSLYGRAIKQKRDQSVTYQVTAGISNTLLLSQVVLGAAVTALGASESSHILITLFGATNTIIAGVVAYLKSRGQPMRARMYRDDLERVVDEIENSEIMWLGISKGMHGYNDINIDDEVTVRSEVARLTRLYDRAIRTNTVNNPDMYMAGANDGANLGLKPRTTQPMAPVVLPGPTAPNPTVPGPIVAEPPLAPVEDPDESPATAPPKPQPKEEPPKEPATKDNKKPSIIESSKGKAPEGVKDAASGPSADTEPFEPASEGNGAKSP